jgi:hypothetical protein
LGTAFPLPAYPLLSSFLRWQSQPAQELRTPTIERLIIHNHLENDILLFLRTKTDGAYVFMGFLKYINHDRQRERPVHFHWQILDFDSKKDYESLLDVKLERAPDATPVQMREERPLVQTLVPMATPSIQGGLKGVAIMTTDFRRSPIDYEERDKKSRKLGTTGEDLVLAYERAELRKAGRHDLAEQVEMVCRTIGDSAGFDIRSFEGHLRGGAYRSKDNFRSPGNSVLHEQRGSGVCEELPQALHDLSRLRIFASLSRNSVVYD